MRIVNLTNETKQDILKNLLKRSPSQYTEYEKAVVDILSDVRERGDDAVFELTNRFDKWNINSSNVKVTKAEIEQAYEQVDPEFIEILKEAAENIRVFHEKQLRDSWFYSKKDGSILGQKIVPIDSVGCYAPGGKAYYPSSVLMNIVPAKVAGVERIALATPAVGGIVQPVTLVAADIAGVDEIYKIGGAQAVGAFAYGTESIKKVDKITGPGNIFVAQHAFQQ